MEFVSGGAPGIDSESEQEADIQSQRWEDEGASPRGKTIYHPEVFPANHPLAGQWVDYGAGIRRNTQIVNHVHFLDVFVMGWSKGSFDSLNKAWMQNKLNLLVLPSGVEWEYGRDLWSPVEYMLWLKKENPYSPVRLALALADALAMNARNPRNSQDPDRLNYANGRANEAYKWMAEGNRPRPGEDDWNGYFCIPSTSKRKHKDEVTGEMRDPQDHHVGPDGACDCKIAKEFHKPCFAMMVVYMHKRLVSPENLARSIPGTLALKSQGVDAQQLVTELE